MLERLPGLQPPSSIFPSLNICGLSIFCNNMVERRVRERALPHDTIKSSNKVEPRVPVVGKVEVFGVMRIDRIAVVLRSELRLLSSHRARRLG